MDFTHSPNQITLFSEDNKLLAKVTFEDVDSHTVDITHTFVDDSLRGQGVAGELMNAAVAQLQSQNKTAVLTCSYAVKWFENHPEYKHLIKK